MTLQVVLPFGDKKNLKNLVFSILSHEYPLKLIELTNLIRRRYGRYVTFQAVRKAVLELKEESVLIQTEKDFQINVEWLRKSKEVIDKLNEELVSKKNKASSTDSLGGEVSVFTFDTLNSAMKFWQGLIDSWFNKFKKGDYPVNCYQAGHIWEVLLHLEQEDKIMGQMKKKGIKSYAIISSNTILDRNIAKFYNKIGIKTTISRSQSGFDKSYYVGTYGDMIVHTNYPKELVAQLDGFFTKNKSLEGLDISELSRIVNRKNKVKITVIKNLEMAKQINKTILDKFLD